MKKKKEGKVLTEDKFEEIEQKINNFVYDYEGYLRHNGDEAKFEVRQIVKSVKKLYALTRKRDRNMLIYRLKDVVIATENPELNLAFAKNLTTKFLLEHEQAILRHGDEYYIDAFNREVKEPYFNKDNIRMQITNEKDLKILKAIMQEEEGDDENSISIQSISGTSVQTAQCEVQ